MPSSLTPRQREYLEYLRSYIKENETSPRLDEIANHFHVKPPTAHKTLEALHNKGYIYFARDSVSGFFIRLLERAGTAEAVIEVVIAGKVNRFGELIEFPSRSARDLAKHPRRIVTEGLWLELIKCRSPSLLVEQSDIILSMKQITCISIQNQAAVALATSAAVLWTSAAQAIGTALRPFRSPVTA